MTHKIEPVEPVETEEKVPEPVPAAADADGETGNGEPPPR